MRYPLYFFACSVPNDDDDDDPPSAPARRCSRIIIYIILSTDRGTSVMLRLLRALDASIPPFIFVRGIILYNTVDDNF